MRDGLWRSRFRTPLVHETQWMTSGYSRCSDDLPHWILVKTKRRGDTSSWEGIGEINTYMHAKIKNWNTKLIFLLPVLWNYIVCVQTEPRSFVLDNQVFKYREQSTVIGLKNEKPCGFCPGFSRPGHTENKSPFLKIIENTLLHGCSIGRSRSTQR